MSVEGQKNIASSGALSLPFHNEKRWMPIVKTTLETNKKRRHDESQQPRTSSTPKDEVKAERRLKKQRTEKKMKLEEMVKLILQSQSESWSLTPSSTPPSATRTCKAPPLQTTLNSLTCPI
jgi:hypothetical protein